jgi:hypothetical protein
MIAIEREQHGPDYVPMHRIARQHAKFLPFVEQRLVQRAKRSGRSRMRISNFVDDAGWLRTSQLIRTPFVPARVPILAVRARTS